MAAIITLLVVLGVALAPGSASAQQGEPGQRANEADAGASMDEAPGASAPSPRAGLPAAALDVAFSEGTDRVTQGATLRPGARLEIPTGGCARLVAGREAALLLLGPVRGRIEAGGPRARLSIESGRGVLYSGSPGATITVGGEQIAVSGGAVAFDAEHPGRRWPLPSPWDDTDASADERPLPPFIPAAADEICAPRRPELGLRLGNPAELAASAEQRRTRDADADGEAATAEGGATCIDSADSSAASDPTQSSETGIDPDARQDDGRVRVIIHVPRRTR